MLFINCLIGQNLSEVRVLVGEIDVVSVLDNVDIDVYRVILLWPRSLLNGRHASSTCKVLLYVLHKPCCVVGWDLLLLLLGAFFKVVKVLWCWVGQELLR